MGSSRVTPEQHREQKEEEEDGERELLGAVRCGF